MQVGAIEISIIIAPVTDHFNFPAQRVRPADLLTSIALDHARPTVHRTLHRHASRSRPTNRVSVEVACCIVGRS